MPGVTETEVSVVTLAELTLGVLMANDSDRANRVATLAAVESTWDPVPVDAEAGEDVRGHRGEPGISPATASRSLDALIAATAIVEQVPIETQDRDYGAIRVSR